MDKDQ